jgi:hypothetical protein
MQAKHPQPFGRGHHRSSQVWLVRTLHLSMLLLWGLQPAHWSRAYSFWRRLPIVPGWIGPSSVGPLHFRFHFSPPRFLVPSPQLILAVLHDLRWVLPTWYLELVFDSSWMPSETPKKWTKLNQSSDTKWRAPKSLVSPKLGLSHSSCGSMGDSRHAPNFQH